MENFIMIFEDGTPYVATKIKDTDIEAINDGILTVIRCSDAKELGLDGNFTNLPAWEND